jgi:CheY-like chemotaxis protein
LTGWRKLCVRTPAVALAGTECPLPIPISMKTVLVVEDSEDDLFMMKMACKRTGIPHELRYVSDGEAAINYLAGRNGFEDRNLYPLPSLIFLDLKLPKVGGHEVLAWIRSQPELKSLPVVVLTSSAQSSDVLRAYELGVTSYLRKIANPAEFGQAVRVILKYWLELNVGAA